MKNIIKAVWHISKKIMHWLHVQFAIKITEYDSDGHMIHYKDCDGNEHWWDADGNIIEQSNEVVK